MGKLTILFGPQEFDLRTGKKPTHTVTHISTDILNKSITVMIEQGHKVEGKTMTIEFAEQIGFINLDALEKIL